MHARPALSTSPLINSIANMFVKEKGCCRREEDDVVPRSLRGRPLSLSLSSSLYGASRPIPLLLFFSIPSLCALPLPPPPSNKSLHSARADLVPSPPAPYPPPSPRAFNSAASLHPSRSALPPFLPPGGLRSASHVHLLRADARSRLLRPLSLSPFLSSAREFLATALAHLSLDVCSRLKGDTQFSLSFSGWCGLSVRNYSSAERARQTRTGTRTSHESCRPSPSCSK
jgi:hypothetical protein